MNLTQISSGSCQISQFLNPDNFAKLEEIMYTTQAAQGSHLFLEGDKADSLAIFLERLAVLATWSILLMLSC
jgi:CRP-like cAMP-binding protein